MKKPSFASLITGSSLSAAPWKNGGGSTKEIAIHPAGSSLDAVDFLWRLSSAEISRAGAFSPFPDFDRLLTVVRGEELVLRFDKIHKSLKAGTVLHFHGSSSVNAELPKGPVTDLGLIYDPDQVLAKMSLIEFENRPRSFSLTSPEVLFFVIEGEIAASVYPGEKEFGVNLGDTLRVGMHHDERIVHLDPGKGRARLAAIELAVVVPKSFS